MQFNKRGIFLLSRCTENDEEQTINESREYDFVRKCVLIKFSPFHDLFPIHDIQTKVVEHLQSIEASKRDNEQQVCVERVDFICYGALSS